MLFRSDAIMRIAQQSLSQNPIEIATIMMQDPYIYMHGNEHHVLVAAALITAYHNTHKFSDKPIFNNIDLSQALSEAKKRGTQIPGGVCGFWGSCGAAISSGIFMAIVTGSTPIKNEEWGLSNLLTSKVLFNIGSLGGPRCCKRNTFTAIKVAVAFCAEYLGVKMDLPEHIFCTFKQNNEQCITTRCPYFSR